MFHRFCDDVHVRSQGAITAEELEEIITGLGPENFLSAGEWMTAAIDGTLGTNQCCVTFDDGLRCQFDIALPVLEKYGLKAFWFIYTSIHAGQLEKFEIYRYFRTVGFNTIDDFYDGFEEAISLSPYADEVASALERLNPNDYKSELDFFSTRYRTFRQVRDDVLGPERYQEIMDTMMASTEGFDTDLLPELWMTLEQIKALHDDGHVIGLHSHTHPMRIDRLTEDEQYTEFSENLTMLEKLTGDRPVCMAHPNNAYNNDTLAALRKLGIHFGFSARPNMDIGNLLELPRQDHGTVLRNIRAQTQK